MINVTMIEETITME